jgi:mannose-6-phosphate isomerase-like protein (cupin superfamily)
MKGFNSNIEKDTLKNKNFRKVLYTGKNSQLVLMSLQPKEEIGLETHPENDQFLRFEGGKGRVEIDGNKYDVKDGDAIIVPAGAKHNVINTSKKHKLKLYTVYSPPHHKDQIIHKTKKVAEADDEDFDGKTTEATPKAAAKKPAPKKKAGKKPPARKASPRKTTAPKSGTRKPSTRKARPPKSAAPKATTPEVDAPNTAKPETVASFIDVLKTDPFTVEPEDVDTLTFDAPEEQYVDTPTFDADVEEEEGDIAQAESA